MNDFERPVSRLPRPVVAGRSRIRTQPVHHLPIRTSQLHHGSTLPLIDLGTSRRTSRRNSVAGNSKGDQSICIPVSSLNDHVTATAVAAVRGHRRSPASHSRDKLSQRPQTSGCSGEGTAYGPRRKTSSGKTHLLKKLQTLSLGSADYSAAATAEEGDSSSSSRFARFQPLPAIGRPTSDKSEPCSLEAESLWDFPTETPSESGRKENEQFEIADFSVNEENVEVQRPFTTYNFERRPDSAAVMESTNLVRSRTYDIIPTGNANNDWTIKEEDEEPEEVVSENVENDQDWPCDRRLSTVAGIDGGLLLAIRSPSDDEEDQCYGYFKEEDKVQMILDFFQEVTGKSKAHCHLAYEATDGQLRYLDLESTIAEAELANRTVLNVVRPEETETNPVLSETLDQQRNGNVDSEETIA